MFVALPQCQMWSPVSNSPTATYTPAPTFTATPTPPPAFTSATFTYDGDGRRVKSIIGGETTLFLGAHYHVENGQITKYYFAGAQRVAVRKNGTLSYMLSDHLGSTLGITNTSGTLTAGTLYKAWGETRYTLGTVPTKFKYTGQREESSFGLYFYNARWYDPAVGRFTSADSVVPQGIQGLDRYAYVNNSPLNFVDPSGHFADDAIKNYLKDVYGKHWREYWDTWSADDVWMNILHSAEAGDYITRIVESEDGWVAEHYYFTGIGEDDLGGIVRTRELGSPPIGPANVSDLDELFGNRGAGLVVTGGYQNGNITVKATTPNITASVYTESKTTTKLLNTSFSIETFVVTFALCNPFACGLILAGVSGYYADELETMPPLPFPVLTGDQSLMIYFDDGKGPRVCYGYQVQSVSIGYDARFRDGQMLTGTEGYSSFGGQCR